MVIFRRSTVDPKCFLLLKHGADVAVGGVHDLAVHVDGCSQQYFEVEYAEFAVRL